MKIHPDILSFMECRPDETKQVNKNWAETLIALLVILLLSAINMWSVKWAARVQNTLTVAKLIGMAVLIIGGLVNLATGDGAKNFESG
jgi:amino acid transporter